jgi:purine-binding chemotaxis protein CheW
MTMNSGSPESGKTTPAGVLAATSVKVQYTTFTIADRLYGIDVMKVQEVTRSLPMTRVPRSPDYVCGLINLRGQIATAISLRRLFKIKGESSTDEMNVVCRIDGLLFSFLVDSIGEVVEVDQKYREFAPTTIEADVRQFIEGIYRVPSGLLSLIDIDKISKVINTTSASEA